MSESPITNPGTNAIRLEGRCPKHLGSMQTMQPDEFFKAMGHKHCVHSPCTEHYVWRSPEVWKNACPVCKGFGFHSPWGDSDRNASEKDFCHTCNGIGTIHNASIATEKIVNHPPHYTSHPSGIECIEITEHLNFNIGNAIKYLWRAGLKNPNPREDLEKARWYVEREVLRLARTKDDRSKP